MANKKISELESRASLSLSDLMAVGDPSTGYLYKTTISDLKTLTGAGVVSFNGRFGTVNPAEGDYTLTQLGDVIITSPSNGQVLKYNGSNWVNATEVSEADTLDTVTSRGNTTANSITVGSVSAAGLSNLVGQIRTFATTGNTYIGANPGSATDAGFKLDVSGTARIGSNPADTQLTINGRTTAVGAIFMQDYLSFTGTNKIIYTNDLTFNTNNALPNGTATRYLFTQAVPLENTGTGIVDLVKILMPVNTGSGSNVTSRGLVIDFSVTTNAGTLVAIDAMQGTVRLRDLSGTGSRMVVTDANGVLSTQAIPTGSVTSVFGRTGTVVAANGDYTTSQVTEGTNLYFTDARARAAITLTTTGSSGAATYSGGTLNIPTYTLAGLGGQPALSGTGFVKISGTTISYDNSTYVTTDTSQTISGAKTFSALLTAGNIKATYLGFPDVNGYSTGIESASDRTLQFKIGSGIAVNIATTNDATFYGKIIKSGGTSSQFLKADGSVDSNTYLTSASVSGVYLPLSGGTLTGALNGTSASFSGSVTAYGNAASSSAFNAYNSAGTSGTAQYYQDFGNGAGFVAGRILRGNGASGLEANGLNIDNHTGFKVRLNQLGGSGGVFTIDGGNVAINTTSAPERLTVAGAIMSTGAITGHGANRTTLSQEGLNGAYWQSYGTNTSTVGTFVLRQASSDFSITRTPLTIDANGISTFAVNGNDTRLANFSTSTYGSSRGLRINSYTSSNGGQDCAIEFDSGVAGYGGFKLSNSGTAMLTLAATGAATFSSTVQATQFIVGSATTSTDVSIRFKADTGDFSLINDRGSHAFGIYDHQVALYRMYINSSGNLGIKTASPNASLDIGSGDIYVRTGTVASNKFETYNGGSTQMYFGFPASGSVAFNNGSDRFVIANTGVATFSGDVKVKTLEVTNVGTDSTSSGVSTYMRITVNGQNYLIPLHGTP